MTTARLVPSTYSVDSSSYVSVSNPSNMYANTDSTNYATLTHSHKSTSAHYVYIKGFNLTSIPSNATVSSFTIKVKGYESSMSTSSSYAPRLVNGTTEISSTTASSNFSTSTNTITIPTGSLTWSQITGYGSDFGVAIPLRRNNKNTTGYVYIYGVEIEVTYTEPVVDNDKIYFKLNGTWTEAVKVYKKVNGSWVEQSDLTTIFSSGTNYVKGN